MRTPTLFRSFSAAPSGALDAPTGEVGADADTWLFQWLAGGPDVNPALSGHLKFQVYDEMQKTDPSVKSLLHFYGLPVRSAKWDLDPADDSPAALVVRDFVAWNLGLRDEDGYMDLSWDESLQQALKCLTFGAMFEEYVFDDVQSWRDADGDAHLVQPLRRLAPRMPVYIARVEMDGTHPKWLHQWLPNAKPIPGDKLSYLVYERDPGRWDGISVLRPAWGPWFMKKQLMVSAGIAWDRFSSGILEVRHPATPDGEAIAKKIGRNWRNHERAYWRFPGISPVEGGQSEWYAKLHSIAGQMADPVPFLRYCSEQIAEAGLQQFTRQGLGQTGARATAEVQSDPYFLAVQALAHYLRRERSRQVIRKLVEVNFGLDAVENLMPKLTVSKIQARSLEKIAQALALFAEAGLTFTDRGATDDIRELLGFGILPDELAEQGIPPAQLEQILQSLGLDSATFAAIVNALPPEYGIARNRDGREGDGLTGTPALSAPKPKPSLSPARASA